MANQTSDGMYEGMYGQKHLNETEADRAKADWNEQNYGNSSNTSLTDIANSAAGKGMGNLLGNLGVVLAVVVLPLYYVPNFIVRVLADFGIMASFWPMFFIVWIPVLALIILVMIKSSPGARVLIIALIIIPIMGTIGVLQMVKVVGGNNADYPYEWYLKALSEKKFEERAEKNLYKAGLMKGLTDKIVTHIYAEPSRNSTVLKEIPDTAFITLTYKRSPNRNMESVEYQGVEGWIDIHNRNSHLIKLRNGRTITIKRNTALSSNPQPKNYTERELENNNDPVIKIKKGQSVTLLGESKAEIARIENTGTYFVKIEYKGDTGWINFSDIW